MQGSHAIVQLPLLVAVQEEACIKTLCSTRVPSTQAKCACELASLQPPTCSTGMNINLQSTLGRGRYCKLETALSVDLKHLWLKQCFRKTLSTLTTKHTLQALHLIASRASQISARVRILQRATLLTAACRHLQGNFEYVLLLGTACDQPTRPLTTPCEWVSG